MSELGISDEMKNLTVVQKDQIHIIDKPVERMFIKRSKTTQWIRAITNRGFRSQFMDFYSPWEVCLVRKNKKRKLTNKIKCKISPKFEYLLREWIVRVPRPATQRKWVIRQWFSLKLKIRQGSYQLNKKNGKS